MSSPPGLIGVGLSSAGSGGPRPRRSSPESPAGLTWIRRHFYNHPQHAPRPVALSFYPGRSGERHPTHQSGGPSPYLSPSRSEGAEDGDPPPHRASGTGDG